jgi:cyclopropane-fatty-acyl-phospholipid synthase
LVYLKGREAVLEKVVLERMLLRISYGRLVIKYWDGTIRRYGDTGPEIEVEIKDPEVVRRLLVNASLAVGEAYMDERLLIAEDDLPTFFELVARNQHLDRLRQPYLHSPNRRGRQRRQISHHYDVGNDYYRLMLDPTLTYSCAYFMNGGDTLERAQHQKIDHTLRKLRIERGMSLLDIGCGWGHLAVAAAKQYSATVLGITLSSEQLAGAQELAESEGVSHLVQFNLMNYQDLAGVRFDRIISVGMFEHVGRRNHSQYFAKIAELLAEDGVSVLHTITQQLPRATNAWIDKYIFPGGYLPTVAEVEHGLARHGLWSIDRENLWRHYARTLELWRQNHQKNRDRIIEMFDERFYRMRDFWLAGSEGGFRHGNLGLTQVVFSRGKPQQWPLTRAYLYQ